MVTKLLWSFCVLIMFRAVELSFHFSERPSFDIELKKYGKDEKRMLAQAVEQMYEVSTVLISIFAWHGWIL